MSDPEIKNDELFQLLRHGEIDEFNKRIANGETCELIGGDFRGSDLRRLNARGLDMRDCYFRQADLRGIDFTETNLEGASISGAKISGTYFPKELRAEEILLSLTHGTRMRYMRLKINVNKLSVD
jgi:uncharacterized protein YjbI with pentapeptide repeats